MGLGTALRAPKRRGDTLWRVQDTQFGKSSSRASTRCGAPATSSTFQARGLSSLAFPGAGVGGGWDLGAQDSRPRRLLAAPRSSAASQVTSGRKLRTELPSGGGWGGGWGGQARASTAPPAFLSYERLRSYRQRPAPWTVGAEEWGYQEDPIAWGGAARAHL